MADSSPLVAGLTRLISRPAEKLVGTPLKVAIDPHLEGVTGKFFRGKNIGQPAPYSRDELVQDSLWDASEQSALRRKEP